MIPKIKICPIDFFEANLGWSRCKLISEKSCRVGIAAIPSSENLIDLVIFIFGLKMIIIVMVIVVVVVLTTLFMGQPSFGFL